MQPRQPKPSVSPARRAAFDILSRVETESAYASALIADLPDLSPEDRALAHEITLGVLRWQKTLDYFIERYSGRSINRFDPPVLIALRIGLYQLRHLKRVPASAAVNESVNLVKRARTASAGALVNAVLRRAARGQEDAPATDVLDQSERESIELSHPRWLLDRWSAHFGKNESVELARANNQAAPMSFRVNTLRGGETEVLDGLRAAAVRVEASQLIPRAWVSRGGPQSALIQAAAGGLIYPQDEASQLVSLLLDAKPAQRVLDLCAAPGSKSTHIAALTSNGAWIVACDLYTHRLMTLGESCSRLGASSVDPVAIDATRDLPFLAGCRFDRVLIDAPCSGTGTLRRHPEIKWRLAPDDIPRLAALQFELVSKGAAAVRPGGRVVYSTCSVEQEENEMIIARLLTAGSHFRVVRPEARADLITDEGFVRTFTHRHGCDGFFAAVLEKEGD